MNQRPLHATWVDVDLGAIAHNVREIASRTRAEVMVVVKAEGYGHGAVPVAKAALSAGASWCGVARVEEALALRERGIEAPILVMAPIPSGRLEQAVRARVALTVCDEEQIRAAAAGGTAAGLPAQLHLKIETGMNRIGAMPGSAEALARFAADQEGAELQGLFTHFARADEPDDPLTDVQLKLFRQQVEAIRADGVGPRYVHAANSAATLTRPDSHLDLVRVGIASYGLHPSPGCVLPPSFRPALSWKTQLTQLKTLPPGSGVSYGHVYVTEGEERIGTIPVGYGDGWRRTSNNQVLVGGIKLPVVGQVCMDQCMVRLGRTSEAQVGDEVVLIGSQGQARISAEDVASRWGTINYEVTCGIAGRVPRVYPSR